MGQCMVCEVCISEETLRCERCLLAALGFDEDDIKDPEPDYDAVCITEADYRDSQNDIYLNLK